MNADSEDTGDVRDDEVTQGGAPVQMLAFYRLLLPGLLVLCALFIAEAGPVDNKRVDDTRVVDAIDHARVAAEHGEKGHVDKLKGELQEALKQAQAAGPESESVHLKQGVKQLKEAIQHAEGGRLLEAARSAKDAMNLMSAALPVQKKFQR